MSAQKKQLLLESAAEAFKRGRFDQAEALYEKILNGQTGDVLPNMMLGIIAAKTDREALAVEYFQKVLKSDPKNVDALTWISGVLSFLERYAEAETYSQRVVDLRPRDVAAILNLATAQFGRARFEEAARSFMRVLALDTKAADAYYGLATTFLRMGQPQQARLVLRDAAVACPGPESALKLGEVALACEEPEETITCVERVLMRHPQLEEALLLGARAYRLAGREAEEDSALARVLGLYPANGLVHALQGRRLQALGRFEDAEREFRIALDLDRSLGIAYYGLVTGRRVTSADDQLLESMERGLAERIFKPDDAGHVHFGLGKAYDNLGRYGEAMHHFDEGNRVMRELRIGAGTFDQEEMTVRVDRTIQTFTREFLEAHRRDSELHPTPIIIAGVMRSGTTLAEQILSRHSLVGAGGEQRYWRNVEPHCVDLIRGTIDMTATSEMARAYSELLTGLAPGNPLVTDKNPANRMVYGLIHLAFPDARLIDMRRNPVDVALSIYTTLIRTGARYMGNKGDIVSALKQHDRLARHWEEVLPQDRLMKVVYEELVREPERVSRAVVGFCGLDWEEACLRPEANQRTVVTPSFWQVRQPVYTDSLDRWKNYEPWLGEFRELLGA